ncbi:hypothetical protein RHSIM_Rhsim06G0236600 [Rhododendron simsii]|uniref:Uncharacterized protein n=1 Tax=Rhododendron simsii TaxID=118357 RepID=A0A834L1Z0_RHOSS|nr:hypothetical protein RHSIM_RhsimUnG0247700 [Rhododendron simsii]KAF7141273.1 hypothetical protein RHSIM_Rhsim06G0236600 [Rhododendron simsii]
MSKLRLLINVLNIILETGGSKYLGLPSIIGKSKRAIFSYVTDCVDTKLKGWSETRLNNAGREVLLKSVILVGQQGERKLQWVSWDKLCDTKPMGGMGFRDLHAFNLAFLARQGWRLVTGPSSFFQKVFWGREVLRRGWRWRVGDGKAINLWSEPWIPRALSFKVLSTPPMGSYLSPLPRKVSDLIDEERHEWNDSLFSAMVDVFTTREDFGGGQPGWESSCMSLICWSIWKNRNQDLFEGQQWEPLVVYEKALLAWKEFKVACDLLEHRAPPLSSPCAQIW